MKIKKKKGGGGWGGGGKKGKKGEKGGVKETKQHVLVLAYDTWGILYQNKWVFV